MSRCFVLCWLSVWLTAVGGTLNLLPERQSEGDLEVSGHFANGQTNGFVAREQLFALTVVTVTNRHDVELQRSVVYTGIALDDILAALPGTDASDAILAVCRDKYAAVFSSEYRHQHSPILVLKMDGKDYADWPRTPGGARMAPFYISYERFEARPEETVAGVVEESLIPFSVVHLKFLRLGESLDQLRVSGAEGKTLQGQTLAIQLCLHCHYSGEMGGRFSGKPWLVVAAWAKAEPDLFQKYIRNPRQVEPTSRMSGFPDFGDEALSGLQSYFSAFLQAQAGK